MNTSPVDVNPVRNPQDTISMQIESTNDVKTSGTFTFDPKATFIFDPTAHISTMQKSSKPMRQKAVLFCEFDNCRKTITTTQKIYSLCACKKLFCSSHRQSHCCTFDYRAKEKARLALELELDLHINKKSKKAGEFHQSPSSDHSY